MPADDTQPLPLLPSIKLLTVKQPWAELIACRIKPIETRTWRTHYRGLLAIHAGLSRPGKADQVAYDAAQRYGINYKAVDYGAIIAVARIASCAPMTADDEVAACCPFRQGTWAWRLADIQRLETPLTYPGRIGLISIAPATLRAIHDQVTP